MDKRASKRLKLNPQHFGDSSGISRGNLRSILNQDTSTSAEASSDRSRKSSKRTKQPIHDMPVNPPQRTSNSETQTNEECRVEIEASLDLPPSATPNRKHMATSTISLDDYNGTLANTVADTRRQTTEPLSQQKLFSRLSHIGKYNGLAEEDFEVWFEDFQNSLEDFDLTETRKVSILKSFLGGQARSVFEGVKYKATTIVQAGQEIAKVFSRVGPSEWQAKLQAMRKKDDQLIGVFAHEVSRAVHRAYPTVDEYTAERMSINYFLNGLRPEVGQRVQRRKPDTLDEAIDKAHIYEAELPTKKENKSKQVAEQLAILIEEEPSVPVKTQIVSEQVDKRNGGKMEVNLCTIWEQMKNNNKQVCQQSGELRKTVEQLQHQQQQLVQQQQLLQQQLQQAGQQQLPPVATNPLKMPIFGLSPNCFNSPYQQQRNVGTQPSFRSGYIRQQQQNNPYKYVAAESTSGSTKSTQQTTNPDLQVSQQISQNTGRASSSNLGGKRCYRCGREGHLKRDCPVRDGSLNF
jgi:hypothetical protein